MEIGAIKRPMVGQVSCGDDYIIHKNGHVTIALADGLGHGPMAELASGAFCDCVHENLSSGLETIIQTATRKISSTRGVVAALMRIDEQAGSLLFSGVGNIQVQSLSTDAINPICVPGIIGRALRKTKQFEYQLNQGDVIAIFSDGISSRFNLGDYKHLGAPKMAETILANHGKHHDDATCITIKY